jgi:hypothetical protein
MEYQVTLFCKNGKYKPISTIVRTKTPKNLKNADDQREIFNEGVKQICAKRYISAMDLARDGFKSGKVRLYDKEKIAKENALRYEKLKEEKYASGEWKRPKK